MINASIEMSGEFSEFADELRAIACASTTYIAGECISSMSDNREKYNWYVEDGLVTCSYIDERGNARMSTVRGAGTIFPLYFSSRHTSLEQTFEFVAMKKSRVLTIEREQLSRLLQSNFDLCNAMMDAWCEFGTYMMYQFELQSYSVKRRVASFLLVHSEKTGEVRLTHAEITQVIGATRENVTRSLAEFVDVGAIEQHRGRVKILSPEKLSGFVDNVMVR